MMLYLKVRNNIKLGGDLKLAEREIKHLCGGYIPVIKANAKDVVSFIPYDYVTSFTRDGNIIGYVVEQTKVEPKKLVRYLSFIQEIWCEKSNFPLPENNYSMTVGNYKCIVPLMAMSEMLFYCNNIDNMTAQLLLKVLTLKTSSKEIEKSICRANTSTPHVHSFHTYKAKFFPRFVRSLIVSSLNVNEQDVTICDPYVGSGTTLIESSLMGFRSFGMDLDPLSCMISRVKTDALKWKLRDIFFRLNIDQEDIIEEQRIQYTFPVEIQRKFQRWNNVEEQNDYERQITKELRRIAKEDGVLMEIDKISLSDALTKKFNIRMMGTGSGRFALDIAKKPLKTILDVNYRNQTKAIYVVSILKELYHIEPQEAIVENGNAVCRNYEDNFFDIIVTSPPYLPASSGREDYVVGKLISLKAMGLLGEEGKERFTTRSVGSMDNLNCKMDFSALPNSVKVLYDWLMKDELRRIKAAPIVSYYNSLKESLKEDYRTIKKGGKIIYIIGKESIFYSMSTKEILYKVECDKIFEEIAQMVGLKINEIIDVELDKKNSVARPRSTDKFYECAIVMSK